MPGVMPLIITCWLFSLSHHGESASSQVLIDTALINRQTTEAYAIARRNPDVSIVIAHRSLSESEAAGYDRGIADASLVMGMALLAEYDAGDSAFFFNTQALEIYRAMDDTEGMARACYGLTYLFSFRGDFSKSEEYALLARQYFAQAGDTPGLVNTLNALAYLSRRQDNLEQSRLYIEEAITASRETDDTLSLADATNSLGNTYKDMALFSRAIDAYFEALKLWESKGDSSGMSIAYGSIGLAYFYQKDFPKALEYTRKHMAMSERSNDLWETAKMSNNIAQIFTSTGQYDSAMVYHRKSLGINRRINYKAGESDACYNYASTLLQLGEVDSAYIYIKMAIRISSDSRTTVPPEFYITLGSVEQKMGRYPQAAADAMRAYRTAKERDLPLVVSDASLLLSEIYGASGRKDLAYGFLSEHMMLRDSISNDEFLKQATRMEIQYDFDKRQKAAEFQQMQERMIQEARIKEQRTYMQGLAILLLLVALFSFLYLRHSRLKARYSRIDLEQRLLRVQMNPHFIFNSLCAVQDLIISEKTQKANTFLTKIAGLMRNILENSREEYVDMEKELETLRLYLEVQQLRFEEGFEYSITVSDDIDPENVMVPPMLAQPCVENSVEHGLMPLGHKGMISISYTLKDGLIRLEITDNGVGRERADKKSKERTRKSISTSLTVKRIEYFRQILSEKQISFSITDLYNGEEPSGTKVIIMLPFRNKYN